MIQNTNDVLAFLIEIASVYTWVKWAYLITDKIPYKIIYAFIAFILFPVVWGLFFSPKAKYEINKSLKYILEFIILFLPFLQFTQDKVWITVIAGVIIIVNLFIQYKMGRSNFS